MVSHVSQLVLACSIKASIGNFKGLWHSALLWDIAMCFESCGPDAIAIAVGKGMPLIATTAAVLGHAVPRFIRWQEQVSEVITPNQGLATGYHTSPSFAHGIFSGPIQKSQQAAQDAKEEAALKGLHWPDIKMLVHVDDFSQEALGTVQQVHRALVVAGSVCCKEAQVPGFTISHKPGVIASDDKLAKGLQRAPNKSIWTSGWCKVQSTLATVGFGTPKKATRTRR